MAEFRGISSMRMFERGKKKKVGEARIFIKDLMISVKISQKKILLPFFFVIEFLNRSINRTVGFLCREGNKILLKLV